MFKKIGLVVIALLIVTGCSTTDQSQDISRTNEVVNEMVDGQPTPTDIDYSLERYNLIKRSYWVNGERERAVSMIPQKPLPLGYIVLFSANSIVAQFTVEGKVSSLNSFLTPNYYISSGGYQKELSDIDGSFGENDNGIFFFTVDGKYVEWTGEYLYSDIPLFIDAPVVTYGDN